MRAGDYEEVDCGNPDVLGFARRTENEEILILLNMSAVRQNISLENAFVKKIIFTTRGEKCVGSDTMHTLDPYLGIIGLVG